MRKQKKQAPCIAFIDEFDAIAGNRNDIHREDRKSVNELLTQMEGFSKDTGVLVIAATNYARKLDRAILRRFDGIQSVRLPHAKEREKLITHFIDIQHSADCEDCIPQLASFTRGFSPSHLKKMVNLAARMVINNANGPIIRDEHMYRAFSIVKEEVNTFQKGMFGTITMVLPSFNSDGSLCVSTTKICQMVAEREQINLVKNIIMYLKEPQKIFNLSDDSNFISRYVAPRNILLTGPPGTGKTYLAEEISKKAECSFYNVTTSLISSAEILSTVFKEAREQQPCIIFFDEFDGIAAFDRNDDLSEQKRALIGSLLSELEGVSSRSDDKIIIIGTTNHLDFDPALLSRFSIINIDLPDIEKRFKLLNHFISGLTKRSYDILREENIRNLSELTDGYSIRDIARLVGDVVRQVNLNEDREILYEDFTQALSD